MSENNKTVRINNATLRIDDIKADDSAEATVRINDINQPTVRLDEQKSADSADSTVCIDNNSAETIKITSAAGGDTQQDAETIRIMNSQSVLLHKQTEGDEIFEPGKTVQLNGINYIIKRIISISSGEAIIYEIELGGKPLVMKHYRKGYKFPEDVISKIRSDRSGMIIGIHDFGQFEERDFEIMDYASGGPLDSYLREIGPLSNIVQLKKLAGNIAEGLRVLHDELGIIYQDLKPENVYFTDQTRSSVVLADFGISSLMKNGTGEAIVRANGTKEYAAPELMRFGNQTEVMAGKAADYFAFGITMYHLWLGEKPFRGIPDAIRSAMVRDKTVEFPGGMDPDLAVLIKGLINPLPKERWGYSEIKKWIAGEKLTVSYNSTLRPYEQRSFSSTETFSTPAELAVLLEKHPERGADYLYMGKIKEWLEKANDMALSTEMEKIIELYSGSDERNAGLTRAIYTLDPGKPFISHKGRLCTTAEELGDALEAEAHDMVKIDELTHQDNIYYQEELKNPLSPFYLYLEAVGGENGKTVADSFWDLFDSDAITEERALNTVILSLQSNGEGRIKLLGKYYYSPEELALETDPEIRQEIISGIMTDDSKLLVWLEKRNIINDTYSLMNMHPVSRFTVLKMFPFRNCRDVLFLWNDNKWLEDACIIACGNRIDLMEFYISQGLPVNGNAHPELLDFDTTPLNCSILTGNKKMASILLDNGADVNSPALNGQIPLGLAACWRNVEIASMLLDRGADPNLPQKEEDREYAPLQLLLMGSPDETATAESQNTIVKLLLEKGADPKIILEDGCNLLHYALRNDEKGEALETVKTLIDAGVDINGGEEHGITPLMGAILQHSKITERESSPEIVELLLKKGARVNVFTTVDECTPLMLAAGDGHNGIVRMLIKYGADIMLADPDGETAYCYAKREKFNDTASILDPGKGLKIRHLLNSVTGSAIKGITILMLFFSFDIVSRITGLISLSPILLGFIAFLLSHFFIAYTLMIICGSFYNYRIKLVNTLNRFEGQILYIFVLPVLFPVLVAFGHRAASMIPGSEKIYAAGGLIPGLIEKFPDGTAVIAAYLVMLAIPMAIVFMMTTISEKFEKVYRMYRSYEN